jgi:hypothetical protein
MNAENGTTLETRAINMRWLANTWEGNLRLTIGHTCPIRIMSIAIADQASAGAARGRERPSEMFFRCVTKNTKTYRIHANLQTQAVLHFLPGETDNHHLKQ